MQEALWKIYCDSFPMEERRRQRSQKQIEKNPLYHIEAIEENKVAVGLICYWDFKEFRFIEHFAIASNARGKGRGKAFLETFVGKRTKPVVLEVEPPKQEETQGSEPNKRIAFYKAFGFALTEFGYLQPLYEKEHKSIPLRWMIKGPEVDHKMLETYKQEIFKQVYGIEV